MKLRSGKTINLSRYDLFKKRMTTVQPFEKVKKAQCDFMSSKLRDWDNLITPMHVNDLFISLLEIPELAANHVKFRNTLKMRVNEIMEHNNFKKVLDKDIRKAIENYFQWLKMRSDYEDDPEIIMARVKVRTNMIKQELIEVLYHPDRYDRMVETYGEIWADIHLPY